MKKQTKILTIVLIIAILAGCCTTIWVFSTKDTAPTAWTGASQEATTIILVRHGQTDYNVAERLQGRLDIPLNETGLAQADALAAYLKDTKIDVVITSPLARANVTGTKVAESHGLPVATDDRLMELNFGDWTDHYKAELKENQAKDYAIWTDTPWLFQMPNGESIQMMGKRGAEAIYEIACENPGATVFIAAHSLFNQATTCELLGLGYEHYSQLAQDNTSISVFRYDGQWKLMMWNAIPHLDMVAKGLPLAG